MDTTTSKGDSDANCAAYPILLVPPGIRYVHVPPGPRICPLRARTADVDIGRVGRADRAVVQKTGAGQNSCGDSVYISVDLLLGELVESLPLADRMDLDSVGGGGGGCSCGLEEAARHKN